MDNNQWYYQNQHSGHDQFYLQEQPPRQQPTHSAQPNGFFSGTSGAEGIMAMHPPASATPITHVARNVMHIAPPLPRFIPHQSYTLKGALDPPVDPPPSNSLGQYPPANNSYAHHQQYPRQPAPFAEHQSNVSQLAASTPPNRDTQQWQHWEYHQRQASRLLPTQQTQHSRYSHPQNQSHSGYTTSQQNNSQHYNNHRHPSQHHPQQQVNSGFTHSNDYNASHRYAPPSSWARSSFETNPFAASVLQGPTSYPTSTPSPFTPPPIHSRSSTLSNALVEPPNPTRHHVQHQQSQPQLQQQSTLTHPPHAQTQQNAFQQPSQRYHPQAQPHPQHQPQHQPPSLSQQYQQQPRIPSRSEVRVEDSARFFGEFLARTKVEMQVKQETGNIRDTARKEVAAPPKPQVHPANEASSASWRPDMPEATKKPPTPTNLDLKPSFVRKPNDSSSSKVETPKRPPATLPSHVVHNADESPDPLALASARSNKTLVSNCTPRKRKPEDMLDSPSAKRAQGMVQHRNPLQATSALSKAQSHAIPPKSSSSHIPKVSPAKRILYVEVPTLASLHTPPQKSIQQPHSATSSSAYRTPRGSVLSGSTKDGTISGSEDDQSLFGSAMKKLSVGTGPRTGDRDQRGPLEKLISIFEDIFEAEDSLPPDADASSITTEPLAHFFSPHTVDFARPMLNAAMITKLTKALNQVARPTKRVRLSSREGKVGTPHQAGLQEVDIQTLQRVLRVLGRSVKAGEEIEPFVGPVVSATAIEAKQSGKPKKKAAPKKGGASKGRGRSQTPKDEAGGNSVEAANQESLEDGVELSENDFERFDRLLELARESVLAAGACLVLLTADKLPKQLYSEELLSSCLAAFKNQLSKVVYPFIEATSNLHGTCSALLLHVVFDVDSGAHKRRLVMGGIFQGLLASIPRIDALVGRTDIAMSDTLVIQTGYIAIGPFFVVELGATDGKSSKDKDSNNLVLSTLGGAVSLRGLRLSALSLVRSIFAHHKDQRTWIIEEILSSLIKLPHLKQKGGQFKLRDGHSIHTVSALLLQLVQTTAHDVHADGMRFTTARQQQAVQYSQPTSTPEEDDLLSEKDVEELDMYKTGLESTTSVAKSIIGFLTLRSGQGKIIKNTKEADYRAIFDTLVSDILTVLYWPEWPAAGLLLGIVAVYLRNSLSDVKTATLNDTNGAKSIALDHLGTIAARLRSVALRHDKLASENAIDGSLKSLDDVVASCDHHQLERLVAAYEDMSAHLIKRSTDDQAYDSARELTAASWGQELARAVYRCHSLLNKMKETHAEGETQYQDLQKLCLRLLSALRTIWQETPIDVFDVGSEADVARLDAIAEQLGSVQQLFGAFDVILNTVLNSLGSPAVFVRTKALRALGQILAADPSILRSLNVRRAIETHVHDLSPAVRDAAVELLGKYIIQMPELVNDYYPVLSDRIADTGLGVRKRIIKLLKSIYVMTEDDLARRIDIGTKLVSRMADEDDTVKDLVVKTLEELWLRGNADGAIPSKPKQPSANTADDGALHSGEGNPEVHAKATAQVVMGVAGAISDRNSSLDDLFHQIASSKEGKEASFIVEQFQAICNVLISSLVDAETYPGFSLVNCVKTVHLLVTAYPSTMTSGNAKSLLPYLKNAVSKDEQAISDYILKIFIACIPHLPKTASQFAQELQNILKVRIQNPPNVMALPESIACFCSVIHHLTHDFARLIGLLKSCNARIKQFIQKHASLTPQQLRPMIVIVYMISLLCEHCDFDTLRTEKPGLVADINAVSEGSITDHVYDALLDLYDKFSDHSVRGPTLRCLGFLFRAKPTLMTRPESGVMMDAIFASPEEDARMKLLKIMQDFLISESEKHASIQRAHTTKSQKASGAINMEELVGNTGGFAESGVSSAVVQRYLPQILEAALSKNLQVHLPAVDILGFTIKQGLAHPLQCMPVIVALETSPNNAISSRAGNLHSILFHKHPGLVNSRHLECVRKSFDYQMQINPHSIKGYRSDSQPLSLLHKWYALIREKRSARQDFLKAVLKVFDLDPSDLKSSQLDLSFARYIAEIISALDFKTQEEVFSVVRQLTMVLSVSGTQMMALVTSTISPESAVDPASMSLDTPHAATSILSIENARASVLIGAVLLLKTYLKSCFGLTEDKCSKWVPGKKTAMGDKPAVRRNNEAIDWKKMTFITKPIMISDDITQQLEAFARLWEEDGVQPEVDDSVIEV